MRNELYWTGLSQDSGKIQYHVGTKDESEREPKFRSTVTTKNMLFIICFTFNIPTHRITAQWVIFTKSNKVSVNIFRSYYYQRMWLISVTNLVFTESLLTLLTDESLSFYQTPRKNIQYFCSVFQKKQIQNDFCVLIHVVYILYRPSDGSYSSACRELDNYRDIQF